MAKKKEAAVSRLSILKKAKVGQQFEVGPGGMVSDAFMSNVRGIRLPSLALMYMFGFTALRDSCSVLIDGTPGSSKSSLSVEFLNWGAPYAATGSIVDCENKASFNIAYGTLNAATMWLPEVGVYKGLVICKTTEAAQSCVNQGIEFCKAINAELDCDNQIPYFLIVDPLTGTMSQETKDNIDKKGHSDRGHGGMLEANLWSTFIKDRNTELVNIPMYWVMVNHVKKKTIEMNNRGPSNYNPGGIAQNFAVTFQIRCRLDKRFLSDSVDGVSYDLIEMKCVKSSRGATGRAIKVRKNYMQDETGNTLFWWDWHRATVEWVEGLSRGHPARDVIEVSKINSNSFNCSKLGLKAVHPREIGQAIMGDPAIWEGVAEASRWERVKEFNRMSQEDLQELVAAGEANRQQFATTIGWKVSSSGAIELDAPESMEDQKEVELSEDEIKASRALFDAEG